MIQKLSKHNIKICIRKWATYTPTRRFKNDFNFESKSSLWFHKKFVGENEKINNLKNESKSQWNENESLIKQKNDLEIKTAKLQELIEDTPTQIREEINIINIQNNKMKNELVQKDNTIKKSKMI